VALVAVEVGLVVAVAVVEHTDSVVVVVVVVVAVAVVVVVDALLLLHDVGVPVFAEIVRMLFVPPVKAADAVVGEAAVAAVDAIESATRVVPFVLLPEDRGVSGDLLVDPFRDSFL
jgi:hypothetical protein